MVRIPARASRTRSQATSDDSGTPETGSGTVVGTPTRFPLTRADPTVSFRVTPEEKASAKALAGRQHRSVAHVLYLDVFLPWLWDQLESGQPEVPPIANLAPVKAVTDVDSTEITVPEASARDLPIAVTEAENTVPSIQANQQILRPGRETPYLHLHRDKTFCRGGIRGYVPRLGNRVRVLHPRDSSVQYGTVREVRRDPRTHAIRQLVIR